MPALTPAEGQPPLQVGDVVRKGNGKTDWYVTSAHWNAPNWGGMWVYSLGRSPNGGATNAGYTAKSLKIVKRKEA